MVTKGSKSIEDYLVNARGIQLGHEHTELIAANIKVVYYISYVV